MNSTRSRFVPILLFAIALLLTCTLHAQTISGVVNNYYKVLAVNMTRSTIKLDNTSFLFPGQRGILIQMKGATVDQSSPAANASWGNITAIGNAGKFELVRICAIQDDSAMLETQVQNTYDINGQVQLVTFPDYANVTISDSVLAMPWDSVSGKGGIVFIDVTDTIYMNDDIVASGKGFAGANFTNFSQGPYNCTAANFTSFAFTLPASSSQTGGKKGEGVAREVPNLAYGKARLSNGGGGGNNHNSGGAGGSNWGTGGQGGVRSRVTGLGCVGNNPGLGGTSLSAFYTNRIFMGGGGGAGHGNDNVGMPAGNGGGIVFIRCKAIYGNAKNIFANGTIQHRVLPNPPYPDTTIADSEGGSGGGGGGAVVIDAQYVYNNLNIEAKGGNGGNNEQGGNNNCMGPGGGGGGGVIWFSLSSTPAGAVTDVSGGAAGVRVNGYCVGFATGSTAGTAGTVMYNYSFTPLDTTFLCAGVLPVPWAINFRGIPSGESVNLSWSVADHSVILFVVEKSFDGSSFTPIAQVNATGLTEYHAATKWETAVCYYRVKAIGISGQAKYSRVIHVKGREGYVQVKIYPNPVEKRIGVNVMITKSQSVKYVISDAGGRILLTGTKELTTGSQQIFINADLSSGIYQLQLRGENFTTVVPFTRL